MAEEDTWESRENLKNAKKLVKEFEREYREKAKEVQWQKKKEQKGILKRTTREVYS